jgi:hypothetical protein
MGRGLLDAVLDGDNNTADPEKAPGWHGILGTVPLVVVWLAVLGVGMVIFGICAQCGHSAPF